MIDTDKYEGHTPAPWKAENKCYRNGVDENNLGQVDSFQRIWGVTLSEEKLSDNRENRIGYDVMHISDAKLIADAPLILAEYMKLRDELNTQLQRYEQTMEYIEWLEEFAPKAGEYNTSWDAYELAMGIHWTQMEEEE